MNTFDLVERHHGVRLICHAIRHLLDHTPAEADFGDVAAIDVLQWAINPPENDARPSCQAGEQLVEVRSVPIPMAGNVPVQSCSNESERSLGIVGEIVRDCPPAEPAVREYPGLLLSFLERLLHGLPYKVLDRVRPAGHESPLRSAP